MARLGGPPDRRTTRCDAPELGTYQLSTPVPNSLPGRGSADAVAGARSYAGCHPISAAAPGTTCGNHRANFSRHPRTSPGMVLAVQVHESVRKAERNPELIAPYKRGVRRFKFYCAHQVFAARWPF
jgi:hypothetical protein